MGSKMKSHWPEKVNAQLELKSAKRWLEGSLRQDRGGSRLPPDVYRMFAVVDAITILDNALDQLNLEAHNQELWRRGQDVADRLLKVTRCTSCDEAIPCSDRLAIDARICDNCIPF